MTKAREAYPMMDCSGCEYRYRDACTPDREALCRATMARRIDMMMLHGLLVIAEDDNVYEVRDCNRRLGAIVRHLVPCDPYPSAVRRFRAFGEDFETLGDAVAEYLKIKGCTPRDALGDCS